MNNLTEFGEGKISKLLLRQAIPASIGFLVLSIYTVVDTIFVGKWVGSLGIAAVSVVAPVHFLISSIGMAIGIGGASIISRALGANEQDKTVVTFGNMMSLTLIFSLLFLAFGYIFNEEILILFGAKGDILPFAMDYFNILLFSIPFLSWAMMCNNIIRAQGHPKVAMVVMILPSISNIIMDPIFIVYLKLGIKGAALSTTLAYLFCALYTLQFLLSKNNHIKTNKISHFILKFNILRDIFKIGGVTIIRQGTISLLSIVINHSLFYFGNESDIATYGIASRLMMFALFPLFGIMQGFMPIVGFNSGAKKIKRVTESINISILFSFFVSLLIFGLIIGFANNITLLFTDEYGLITKAPNAIRIIFLSLPLIGVQFISSAYFQSIGKALPALILTVIKQILFLIPLILFLPIYYSVKGIWYAFPISDVITSIICWIVLKKEIKKLE